MKFKLLITLLLLPLLTFGNMAQPWVDGSEHSTLYGAKNCRVIKENISVNITNAEHIYYATYKIKYTINSDVDQTIPLIFIGIDLSGAESVRVNNVPTKLGSYEVGDSSEISFAKGNNLPVDEGDLMYFEAKLNKGENTIYIEYAAKLDYNTYGTIRTYKLRYSLYPSKFWKSFGPIDLEISLGNNLKLVSSNIGKPRIENNIAKWGIKKINTDNIEIGISKKPSSISRILLYVEPLGIAIIFLILMFVFHLIFIREKHKQQSMKYKYALSLGIVIIPILFYVVYLASYYLIDFTLGQENQNHGYNPLYFIFTLPILMLLYGILMYVIDRIFKSKYKELNGH